MKQRFSRKWLIAGLILLVVVVLYVYNRPAKIITVLMSTPLIYRDSQLEPFKTLPEDVSPPDFDIFYATDREPVEMDLFHPAFYGNERSWNLSLGVANVRLGTEKMNWPEIRAISLMGKRPRALPLNIEQIETLHRIGSVEKTLKASLHNEGAQTDDPFIARINHRLENSDTKSIFIFVPGFKVDFTYPVLVAAELWYYMGCPGAFIAYSCLHNNGSEVTFPTLKLVHLQPSTFECCSFIWLKEQKQSIFIS